MNKIILSSFKNELQKTAGKKTEYTGAGIGVAGITLGATGLDKKISSAISKTPVYINMMGKKDKIKQNIKNFVKSQLTKEELDQVKSQLGNLKSQAGKTISGNKPLSNSINFLGKALSYFSKHPVQKNLAIGALTLGTPLAIGLARKPLDSKEMKTQNKKTFSNIINPSGAFYHIGRRIK